MASIGLGSVNSYATETNQNTAPAQEQNVAIQSFKITKSEKVEEFKTEKQFKKLLKKYQIFDTRTGEQIKYHQLNFKNPNFSLNDSKYLALNSNQEPNVEFNTNEKGYEFAVNFVQSDDYLHSNHLASHKFAYSYDLPAEFLNSSTYKNSENKPKIKGYIVWDKTSGTYSVNAIQYILIGDGIRQYRKHKLLPTGATKFQSSTKINWGIIPPIKLKGEDGNEQEDD